MRITNKIMQRNNLSNINTNKIYQDRLSTQMSTQKKISRPSDDPVVAIRALRLRSSVTEITQYYSKNIPDANSWLEVTEDALNNLSSIVKNMYEQCTKGAQGDLTSKNRQIILEQLQALSAEVYATGDADYAGRYVFTGYRTDTSLSFSKAQNVKYEITEQLDSSAITSMTHVNTGKLLDWTASNYNTLGEDAKENAVAASDVYRIRLAYDKCSGVTPSVSFQVQRTDASGNAEIDADGRIIYDEVNWPAAAGADAATAAACEIKTMHDYEDPYTYIANNDDAAVFVPETGELLLGRSRYDQMMSTRDDPSTVGNEAEIRITYQKEEWLKGDLRPEHYFYCKQDVGGDNELEFNQSYLTSNRERQEIEYDVGFNQTIRVNSTADECFQHGIGREADDLVASLQEVLDLEEVQKKIKKQMENAGDADAKVLQDQLDAVDKALTFSKDKCQKLFERGITTFQGYLDDATLCITNCGTRSSKLELIENRMQSQKTTFETLKSENEDIDIAEVAIQLSSAEMTYEAALMATGKVMQTTLLNFI